MSKASSSLLHVVRTMTGAYRHDSRSDEDLLLHYATTRDEKAFATLMVRHGPMVWGTCSRILGNTQDVEDACQVVLLALADRADKGKIKSVVGWLHLAARHTALNVRKAQKSRKRLEDYLASHSSPKATDKGSLDADYELLHNELARLPEKLRIVLVLHYLEGKTEVETAQILGIKNAALRKRISRGKSLLHSRLQQRGLSVGEAALIGLLTESASYGAMPPGLVVKTLWAATAYRDGKFTGSLAKLAQELLAQGPAATPWWKTGWLIAIVCVSGLGLGVGGAVWRAGLLGPKTDQSLALEEPKLTINNSRPNSPRLDLYGDPLPPGALARLGTVRFRHDHLFNGNSTPVILTADEKLFILGNGGTPFRGYDLTTGKPATHFQNAEGKAVPFAPDLTLSLDGRLIAQHSPSRAAVEFWRLDSGKRLDLGVGIKPSQMALSPDGKNIAAVVAAVVGDGVELHMWNLAGEKLWASNASFLRQGIRLSYSADGTVLMAAYQPPPQQNGKASDDDHVIVHRWETAAGKELSSWKLAGSRIGFAWSRDGSRLALKNKFHGNTISLWNMTTGKRVRDILLEAEAQIGSLCLSPSGNLLAAHAARPEKSGELSNSLCLWDAATGKLIRQWASPTYLDSKLVFSHDGKRLASVPGADSNRFIYVWDVASGKRLNQAWHEQGHTNRLTSIVFSPQDGALTSIDQSAGLMRWSRDSAGKYAIRASRPTYDERLSDNKFIWLTAVAPNGKIAAYGTYHNGMDLHVCDATTSKEIATLSGPPGASGLLAFSPNNQLLVANNGTVQGESALVMHNLSTKKCGRGLIGECFAFSPTNPWMAVGPIEDNVCLWDPSNNRMLAKTSCGREVFGFAFSGDGRFLAASTRVKHGVPASIRIWRVRSDPSGVRLEGPLASSIDPPTTYSRLTFSPNGRILAAVKHDVQNDHRHPADVVIHLWETMSGLTADLERRCFNEGGSVVKALAFAHDGRRLASGHDDASILIWDLTDCLEGGKLRPTRLSAAEVVSLWQVLAGTSSSHADRAIWKLAAGGAPTLAFLKKQLQPALENHVSSEELSQLIANLDADNFAVRQKAKARLESLAVAEAHVHKALQKKPSVEVRRWLILYREKIALALSSAPSIEELRNLRALEVLEQMDDVEARRILERLASGRADARLTLEAQAALTYWKQLHQKQ